ncbi:F-box/LRR-repeat protein At3g59190-like [Raphanus sativus]|uniref:F-box/LRR-repeat protein At3g59190-like n=1 Tax=Raphanus sativus TaxID=3726 RepID=A0A9W3C615_RAPSA|nr:F-box/LRR-repeat protein At3g59190-like [Raphanus sativus]
MRTSSLLRLVLSNYLHKPHHVVFIQVANSLTCLQWIPKKIDTGSKDLISSLPDALIGHILSFLSTKDAALTSVLSKRWRNLIAFVTNLDLDNTIYDRPKMGRKRRLHLRKSFRLFVERLMSLQGNAPLNKVSLRCRIGSDPSRVNGWLLKVLERGVVDLDLFISSADKYPLPPQVLMSKTLVRLKVAGTDQFVIDVRDVSLPELKTLHMNDVSFADESGAAFAKLVSGCHALEELVIVKMYWDFRGSCSVSNSNLKRLTICTENIDETSESVSFDTPNLVYLEFTDIVAAKYPKVNLDSLVEASVGIRMTPNQVFRGRDLVNRHYGYKLRKDVNATDFLVGISNVKILYLSSQALEVLTFCCKEIPVFNNLIHLTIETDQDVDWESLPNLLKNCPNIETLVFEGLHYGDTNQCEDDGYRFKDTNECFVTGADRCVCKPWLGTPSWLSSSPVKKLKVLKFGEITNRKDDMDKQTDLINYFVETMPNLEEVVLYYDTPFDSDLEIVSNEFQQLEKVASTKCKIQVISDNISISTTVYSTQATSRLAFFKNRFPV